MDKSCVCSGCTDRQRRGGLDDSDDWVVDDLSGLEMRKEKFVMRLKKEQESDPRAGMSLVCRLVCG